MTDAHNDMTETDGAKAPSVSVVLAAYNAGDYLRSAVASILAQDDADFELVLVDDGSKDGSVDALVASTDDPRLRVVRQANAGLSAALNTGIATARGRYIARMDGDDRALAGRLAHQARYLDEHPDVVLVGGQIERFIGDTVESASAFPLAHEEIVAGLLRGQHVVCHPSVMMRTDTVRRVGGYWTHGLSEDWDLFLRLSSEGRLANLPDLVLQYRYHDSGINASSMASVRRNIALAVANHRRRVAGRPELDPAAHWKAASRLERIRVAAETRSLVHYRESLSSGRAGKRLTSRAHLLASALLWPQQALRRVLHRAG